MYELLPTMPTNGRSKRTAVSKSKPVRLNAPSPKRHTTSRSGSACLAPMQNGMPTPIVPSGPGSIHRPGPLGWTTPPENVTMSPPSPMNREFVGEELVDLVREAQRVDRRRVLHEARQALLLQALLLGAELSSQPSRFSPLARPLAALATSAEDRARVADEAERDVAVLADRPVVHVDLDDCGLARQALAVAHPEVERRADDEDHVGVVERVAAREVEVVRVARRERAARGAVHVRGDVQLADELDRLLVAARRSRPGCRAARTGARH